MSLGLAVAKGGSIFLAAESQGLSSKVLPSKIISLQDSPTLAMIVTGGLEHWRDVKNSYKPQLSIESARDEVVQLLNKFTGPSNQAFALLCGFNGVNPVCYRIGRLVGSSQTTIANASLTTVQGIGIPGHASAATVNAKTALANQVDPELALRQAIESRMPASGLAMPIETTSIKR